MENREGLRVGRAFKFYVVKDGRRVLQQFRPGDFLPRQDWDREATARSKRSMMNAEFVREDTITIGSGATVVDTTNTQTRPVEASTPTQAKRRGRPRKVK